MDLRDVKVNGFCDRAIAASRPDYSGDRTWKEEELAKRQPIDATNIWTGGLLIENFLLRRRRWLVSAQGSALGKETMQN